MEYFPEDTDYALALAASEVSYAEDVARANSPPSTTSVPARTNENPITTGIALSMFEDDECYQHDLDVLPSPAQPLVRQTSAGEEIARAIELSLLDAHPVPDIERVTAEISIPADFDRKILCRPGEHNKLSSLLLALGRDLGVKINLQHTGQSLLIVAANEDALAVATTVFLDFFEDPRERLEWDRARTSEQCFLFVDNSNIYISAQVRPVARRENR